MAINMCNEKSLYWLQKIARWSYFTLAVFSFIGAFVHLHVNIKTSSCVKTEDVDCIGDSLEWRTNNQFSQDSNAATWRNIFTFRPDTFIDNWTPFVMAVISILQHFEGCKWNLISGSWFRALLWIVTWIVFGIIGYGANWGVIWGFIGFLFVMPLYLLCFSLTAAKNILDTRTSEADNQTDCQKFVGLEDCPVLTLGGASEMQTAVRKMSQVVFGNNKKQSLSQHDVEQGANLQQNEHVNFASQDVISQQTEQLQADQTIDTIVNNGDSDTGNQCR